MTAATRVAGVLRDALLYELAIYRSLARWATGRLDVPRGATPIGYSRLVTPMLWLWIFGSSVEVVVVEFVLRSLDQSWAEAARLPLLALGVWGVVWMVGMLASYRVRPHLLTASELRARSGARTWLLLPLAEVESTRPVEHELPGVIRSLHVEGDLALVGVGSRTNLEIVLRGPTTLSTSKGQATVTRVGIWVDEPRATGALLRPVRGTRRSRWPGPGWTVLMPRVTMDRWSWLSCTGARWKVGRRASRRSESTSGTNRRPARTGTSVPW